MPAISFSGITDQPLNRDHIEGLLSDIAHGALVTFVGKVRNHDPEATGEVIALEYSCHPDAEKELSQIVTEFTMAHSQLSIAAFHRIGKLEVGDSALIVCVSAPHRTDTFAVCKAIVEQIKIRVPIWKKQLTETGEAHWVGMS